MYIFSTHPPFFLDIRFFWSSNPSTFQRRLQLPCTYFLFLPLVPDYLLDWTLSCTQRASLWMEAILVEACEDPAIMALGGWEKKRLAGGCWPVVGWRCFVVSFPPRSPDWCFEVKDTEKKNAACKNTFCVFPTQIGLFKETLWHSQDDGYYLHL